MAESPGVVEQVTKAPTLLIDAIKKYWLLGPLVAVLLIAVGFMLKPSFTRWTTSSGSSTPGDRLGNGLRSLLKISGFLLPVGFVLLGADYVQAACAAHGGIPCGADAANWFSHYWHLLAALLSTSGVGFAIHMTAPDLLDGFNDMNGRVINYTPGAANVLSMYAKTANKNQTGGVNSKPLIAVNSMVTLDTTVENLSTGTNPIQSQDLARLLDSLEISTPFHGTILDKLTGTGPNLDLVINFIGQGFARAGDAPTLTIVVGTGGAANDQVVSKQFTFPWAQRYMEDPSITCPWLLTLDNANFSIGIAASTALGAVSTGAVTKNASRIRLGTSYWKSPVWRQGLIPYWRVDAPASNSDGLSFQNFGGAGPTGTKPLDRVHTLGLLSNLKGLKGNQTFDNITNIIAPDFGMDDVINIDMFVTERLRAQFRGRIGNYDYATGGNHVQGTANNGAAIDKLLFLLLLQPSVDTRSDSLPVYESKTTKTARLVMTTPLTTQHAFIVGAHRELSAKKMADQATMSAGKIPNTYAQARHYTGKV